MRQEQNERKPQQTIWGINPKDRIWFTTITGIAGAAWSAIIVRGNIINREPKETLEATLTEIALGTAGAFASSGSGTWLILNVKDAVMSIAEAIRERTAKRTEDIFRQGQEQGIRKLIAQADAKGDQEFRDKAKEYADEINLNGQSG